MDEVWGSDINPIHWCQWARAEEGLWACYCVHVSWQQQQQQQHKDSSRFHVLFHKYNTLNVLESPKKNKKKIFPKRVMTVAVFSASI